MRKETEKLIVPAVVVLTEAKQNTILKSSERIIQPE